MSNMQNSLNLNARFWAPLIWTVSFAIPVVVAILLTPNLIPAPSLPFDPHVLPMINAAINSTVSLLLLLGFAFIRMKRIAWHRAAMLSAYVLSALFLVIYVTYHLATEETRWCPESPISRPLYLTLLISHIGLSVTIVPLATFSIYRALSERYDRHKRLARITFPLWLYVAITGVLVYFCISPCY
jgi:putative membrane protein